MCHLARSLSSCSPCSPCSVARSVHYFGSGPALTGRLQWLMADPYCIAGPLVVPLNGKLGILKQSHLIESALGPHARLLKYVHERAQPLAIVPVAITALRYTY
jgi:hypothetical protein